MNKDSPRLKNTIQLDKIDIMYLPVAKDPTFGIYYKYIINVKKKYFIGNKPIKFQGNDIH